MSPHSFLGISNSNLRPEPVGDVVLHTDQCRGHLLGHGKYAPLRHLTRWSHLFLQKDTNLIHLLDKYASYTCGRVIWTLKLRQVASGTSLHRHRKLSRSLFSSSSMTVTNGARSDTTPRSSGRKGCGPSWAKKDAKLRKLCLSVALAVSGTGGEDGRR